ncbi:MAG: hypothetical protein AAGA80_04360 [Cyanobacteria bacterium P01_F01_bin.143]
MLEPLSNSDELELAVDNKLSAPQLPNTTEPTSGTITSANILESSDSPEILKSWRDVAEYVAIPGAIGGVTRFLWEVIDPEARPTSTQVTGSLVSDYPSCAAVYCRAPIYTTMGMIGALIGTILLANFIRLESSKNHQQRFQLVSLSIVFGLFFSNVLSLAKEQFPELTPQEQAEQQINQFQTDLPEDPESQRKAIANIENIAQSSADPEVDIEALQSTTSIARISDDPAVDIAGIETISVIVQNSTDNELDADAIQSIASIAQTATEVQVDIAAVQTIVEITQTSEDITVQQNSVLAIAAIARSTTDPKLLSTTLQALQQLAVSFDESDFLEAIVQTIENIIQSIPANPEPSQSQSFTNLEMDAIDILENILQIAQEQNGVQLAAIDSLGELGTNTKISAVRHEIIAIMERIAQDTFDERIQQELVSVIVTVAKTGDLEQGRDTLNRLQKEVPDLKPWIDEALEQL